MRGADRFRPRQFKDIITTITASMFGGKEVSDGTVTRVTSQAIFSDVRVGSDSAGGPVFTESGALPASAPSTTSRMCGDGTRRG